MDVLFVVPYTPNLIRVRPYQLLRALARRGHRLTLVTTWTSLQERADLDRLAADGMRVRAWRLPAWRSALSCLQALASPAPLQASFCWQPGLAREVRRLLQTERFDVVHVEHLRGARYGLAAKQVARDRPPVIWDSVDCISHLFAQAARTSRSRSRQLMTRLELARTQRYEAWLLAQFDSVVVTSAADRQALLGLTAAPSGAAARSPIHVLPNGVDLEYFTPSAEPREPATVVLSGKMSYHANVTAAVHLVREVMPHVWARRPDVKVWLVGKDPPRQVRALANARGDVRVVGSVPDIRPFLRRATLALAPVPYGAGIQNKVLEALACATPVVASRQATLALGACAGRDLMVASSAEDMARAVVDLLAAPGRRAELGRAGRAYVETQHAWGAIAADLEDLYRDRVQAAAHQQESAA